MDLSLQLTHEGNCRDVVGYYNNVFKGSAADVCTYGEMPQAEAYGITGSGLELIWQSTVKIRHGGYTVNFDMSDSMLLAMQSSVLSPIQLPMHAMNYPQVYVACENEEQTSFISKKLQLGANNIDLHGIQWLFGKGVAPGIFHHFEFDGFCRDVLAHYETAFGVKATTVAGYDPTLHGGKAYVHDKISFALIEFESGGHKYAISLCDSLDSALANRNTYDPTALLFYKMSHNPLLNLRGCDAGFAKKAFEALSVGGKLNKPLSPASEGSGLHGSLIDKYGICWEISYNA